MSQLTIVDLDFINSESCTNEVKGGEVKKPLGASLAADLKAVLVTKFEAKLSDGKSSYKAAAAAAGAGAGASAVGSKASVSVNVKAEVS